MFSKKVFIFDTGNKPVTNFDPENLIELDSVNAPGWYEKKTSGINFDANNPVYVVPTLESNHV